MEEQRTRAKASWKGAHKEAANPVYAKLARHLQDRARFLLWHEDDATAASKPSSPKKARSTKSRPARKPKSFSTAPRSTPNPAARSPTSAASTIIPNRSKWPKCAARIIRSAGLVAHRIVAKEDLHVGDRVATVADPQRRAPQHAQPHRHAPDARRAAQYPRHAREAGRLARRARPSALRFFALRRRRPERTRRNRAAGERRNSAQSRSHAPTS